jgi:lipoprotein-anchoring transpeptidase ErfK/SrfK
VKRGFFAAHFVLGLTAAAVFTAAAVAAVPKPASPAKRAKPAPYIAPRVEVAGVPVGGMEREKAIAAVEKAFAKRLTLVVNGAIVHLRPSKYAVPYVATAVGRAHAAAPGAKVDMVVSVHGGDVRAAVRRLARRFHHAGVDARLIMRAGEPFVTKEKTGHRLDQNDVVVGIVRALNTNTRPTMRFKLQQIEPGVTRKQIGGVILINRGLNRLTYFGDKLIRRFGVATGQSIYPTPSGKFQIVVKYRDPWWYPPTYDSWARDLKPVPPGPSNPLGTRWMGLSTRGVGIHGTNNPSSIGYSVSHGCIRMQVPDAEWLFDHVDVGTTVVIV